MYFSSYNLRQVLSWPIKSAKKKSISPQTYKMKVFKLSLFYIPRFGLNEIENVGYSSSSAAQAQQDINIFFPDKPNPNPGLRYKSLHLKKNFIISLIFLLFLHCKTYTLVNLFETRNEWWGYVKNTLPKRDSELFLLNAYIWNKKVEISLFAAWNWHNRLRVLYKA